MFPAEMFSPALRKAITWAMGEMEDSSTVRNMRALVAGSLQSNVAEIDGFSKSRNWLGVPPTEADWRAPVHQDSVSCFVPDQQNGIFRGI